MTGGRANLQEFARAAALALGIAFAAGGPRAAEPFRFAAFGDLPYTRDERAAMPRWIAQIAAAAPAFAIHVGDFKTSREPCSDAMFADRLGLFDASAVPLIYTPGDNEWSDCDILAAGAYAPTERLDRLRQLFFARPESLGRRKIALERQPGAPENARWEDGRLVFLTLNLPASNNHGPKPAPSAELAAREPLLLDWIEQGFARARQRDAAGVVIAFQANPGFRLLRRGLPTAGFRRTLTALQEQAARWGRPLLLIHGDTHTWRFDQPLPAPGAAEPLPRVWRVEVPGSPRRGWVEVRFDASRPDAAFSATLHEFD